MHVTSCCVFFFVREDEERIRDLRKKLEPQGWK